MTQDLEGRRVVISGASSGIGLAAAQLVAERGGTAIMLGRRLGLLDSEAASIGVNATAFEMDVTEPSSIVSAFAQIEERFDYVDALINAAGAMRYRRIEEHSEEDIDAVINTNLRGPILTIRAALPLLRRSSGADIVNLGSETTELYLPRSSVYTATKAGLTALSDCIGRELRPEGIRVTLVVVGYTRTGISALIPQEDRDRAREAVIESAYPVFSGTTPMDARWVAETALYPITRPRGERVGVIHSRSMS